MIEPKQTPSYWISRMGGVECKLFRGLGLQCMKHIWQMHFCSPFDPTGAWLFLIAHNIP